MNRQSGFSLIELMIALAILGILASIAWPSYREHVRTTHRSQAQSALMGMAQAMERHFTKNSTYAGAAVGGADAGSPEIFPAEAPLDATSKTYDLVIVEADSDSYVLEARPKNGQAGDGNLQLRSSGEKGWDRGGDGFADEDMCWSKVCH